MTRDTPIERRVHLARDDRERALVHELRRVFPAASHAVRAPGFVESRLSPADAAAEVAVAFAAQCLPRAEDLTAPSVGRWGATLVELLVDRLADHGGPWRLHVFGRGRDGAWAETGRGRLVLDAVRVRLGRRQRRLLRHLILDPVAPWTEGEALVQLALESTERGVLSICPPGLRRTLRHCLSRLPAGAARVPVDRRPPSRAYRKLLEAEIHLGRWIGRAETCVDLGAAPGGWTCIALDRGARVVAVDRAPLRADLMASPRLTFVRGDAFRYEPERPADWLLCDVIAFPKRTLELIERWLARRLCRSFCVTVKFKGEADDGSLEELKRILARRAPEHAVRALANNKNEVTAFGEVVRRFRGASAPQALTPRSAASTASGRRSRRSPRHRTRSHRRS